MPQDALDPCYNFVTGRVGGLVEINHTRANVGFEIASIRCTSMRNWSEVRRANKHCSIISENAALKLGE